jgi:hypothetical protein
MDIEKEFRDWFKANELLLKPMNQEALLKYTFLSGVNRAYDELLRYRKEKHAEQNFYF